MNKNVNNPLLRPFDQAPFSKIEVPHFLPAFEHWIAVARSQIEEIVKNEGAPDFTNTIEALEFSGIELDRVAAIFFNLNAAETTPEIQQLAQQVSPMLTAFNNDILLNEPLFKKVKSVYDDMQSLDLTEEQETLLKKKYRHFSRNGALLSEEEKVELRKIDKDLAQLKLKFGENVLAATNRYEMHLTQEHQIAGLPEGAREAAAQLAESKGKKGWVITLDYPSYGPFMKYAENRELRKRLFMAYGSKCFQDDELDNKSNIIHIVQLRFRRAQLLGFTNHAHFVLEERMAKSPEKVTEFLKELLVKAKPAALREFEELQQFAFEASGLEQLMPWDAAYYSEKLKQARFQLDDEILKPYFKLENVIDGVFAVANKLFGLRFEEVQNVDTYHPEVRTYEVYDDSGKYLALFYGDFHPRPGKRGGAWMTSYKSQYRMAGEEARPHISNVCNFTKPTATKPSLLTFREVLTLFHEFGHALHGMLADSTYPSLSGTSVYWDFVELPSQILENWCYEKDALELFATHYLTGEVIPKELIDKLRATSTFQEGMATLRQIGFSMLDMAWHGTDTLGVKDVKSYELTAMSETLLFDPIPETCMSTAFSHIFQGGYSAGYYSYKWAEVLDADAFQYFKEEGVFDKRTANLFREHILSKGGTADPMILYRRFRGREPKIEALLERAGLVTEENT